jgi:hypothetical protein
MTPPQGRLIPAVVLAGGALLLVLTVTQMLLLLTGETDDAATRTATGREFEPPQDMPPSEDAQDPFAPSPELARESHPGPLVRELVALLKDSGIETYRYRVTRHAGAGADAGFAADDEEDWALPPDENDEGEEFAIDLGIPSDVLGQEAAMAVADLLEWRIALRLEASYADVMSFFSSLPRSGRVWALPRLSLAQAPHGITTNALLLTWTEPSESEMAALAVSGVSGSAARDPFHGLVDEGARGRRLPALPHLGAISHGPEPIAWLDGKRVGEGDRLGSWTVMQIAVADVTLRHESGTLCTVRGDHDLLPQR